MEKGGGREDRRGGKGREGGREGKGDEKREDERYMEIKSTNKGGRIG